MPADSLPTHAIDRAWPLARLDEGLKGPLSLVIAPAGAGKSVLLRQWARSHPEISFVFLSLSSADDDPVQFSQRIVSALSEVGVDASELSSFVALNGGGLGNPQIEALAAILAELPATVIVIDDLHELSNETLIADLGRLVGHLPDHVHLVLASRVDPPIAWSRYRVRSEVIELRQADLAFDPAGASELLQSIAGQAIPPSQVELLVRRTEGWVTGLQLAGMTLRLSTDPGRFIEQFSGNDRLVAEYLSEEVVDAQSSDRRQLLLAISVPDEICADLVTRITGIENAQEVLDDLERESMFLVPVDGLTGWYRYHQLFRDLLRFRLRSENPKLKHHFLQEAAHWHLEHHQTDAAVELLLRAEEWEAVLDLIASRGSETFERGHSATVARWISTIPEEFRKGRCEINLLLGVLVGQSGRMAEGEDILRQVLTDRNATAGERACAQVVLSVAGYWTADQNRPAAAAVAALAMLEGLGEEPTPDILGLSDRESLRTLALVSGGRAHLFAGRWAEARHWVEEGLASPGATYSAWRISALGTLGLLETLLGRVGRGGILAAEALRLADEVKLDRHPVASDSYLALGLGALERSDPTAATDQLKKALIRAEANRRISLMSLCRIGFADALAAEGDLESAVDAIRRAEVDLGERTAPIVAERRLALRARALRMSNRALDGLRLLDQAPLVVPEAQFERALCALASRQFDVVDAVVTGLRAMGSDPLPIVQMHILEAWMADVKGDTEGADSEMHQAVDVAEQFSLSDVFLRAGLRAVQLVNRLPGHAEFRHQLVARARVVIDQFDGSGLAEELTEREFEILNFLPTRMTNNEIAAECFISVNTIKTHMAHIYRKLDATNRSQAIVQARKLGLL